MRDRGCRTILLLTCIFLNVQFISCSAGDDRDGEKAKEIPTGSVILAVECLPDDPQAFRVGWRRLQEKLAIADVGRGEFSTVIVRGTDRRTRFSIGWSRATDRHPEGAAELITIESAGGCSIAVGSNMGTPLVLISGSADQVWVAAEKGNTSLGPLPMSFPAKELALNLVLLSDDVQQDFGTSVVHPPEIRPRGERKPLDGKDR